MCASLATATALNKLIAPIDRHKLNAAASRSQAVERKLFTLQPSAARYLARCECKDFLYVSRE
jgi:hypothetical protein